MAAVALAPPFSTAPRAVAAEEDPYASQIAKTPPLSPEEEREKFHLPPGFEIQLVAAEPDINKPLNLAFDHRNRLWVTTSVEYPFPVKEGAVGRDRVRIMEDVDGDGRADKFATFADGLSIPSGVLPMADGALVWSIPYIWRMVDRDGDDVADERVKFLGPFDYRDTHGNLNGFTWGFDGWIYMCYGFSNDSRVAGTDGHEIHLDSGNTIRARPDGSRVEHVTHGQVNPFGLVFDPLGSMYTADCHSRPVYQLLFGAWYPGRPDDGLGYGPETCDHDHGSTAIAGICYYAADHFPEEYRGSVFTGNVLTIKVNHDRIERHGASNKAVHQPDFIRCDDPWFRPVDFQLGPDGALYIADFYNRLIGHYEVPLTHPGRDRERGRIWRVIHTGPDGKNRPAPPPRADFSKATLAELIEDIGHPNLHVRTQATNQLADRIGSDATELLRELMRGGRSAAADLQQSVAADLRVGRYQRIHALWALQRAGGLDEATLTQAARDEAWEVRLHVQRVLAERAMGEPERKLALAALADAEPFVRLGAAEALRRHPHPDHVVPLLQLRRDVRDDDPKLRHVVRMAIRDQLELGECWERLRSGDQFDAFSPQVLDVILGVHTSDAGRFLLDYLAAHDVPADAQERYVAHVAQFPYGEDDAVLKLVTQRSGDDLALAARLLRSLHTGTQRRGASMDGAALEYGNTVARGLLDAKKWDEGIQLARDLRLAAFEPQLEAVALDGSKAVGVRKQATHALVEINPREQAATLGRILKDVDTPQELRNHIVELTRQLSGPEALDMMTVCLRTAPGKEAVGLASSLCQSQEGIILLLDEIEAGRASARLLLDRGIRNRVSRRQEPEIQQRVAKLTENVPSLEEEIAGLIKQRREAFAKNTPDADRGRAVFEKTCGVCHRVGDLGKQIGPELDGIGLRGADRLLEDILDPSRNVDQAYRTTVIKLVSGGMKTGLVKAEEGAVVTLADAAGELIEIPKNEIEDRWVQNLSPMPSNIASELPEDDFLGLLAFLLAQRAADTGAQ